jgi:dihydrofolate reductase
MRKIRRMRTLTVFNTVSLDGYFTDANSKIDWAHKNANDPEWQEYVSGNAMGESVMLFGRKTYEMMKSHWPTPEAKKQMPEVARSMNESQKVVFSRSLKSADWQNTRVENGDLVETVRRMKGERGADMIIFGSGSIIAQLAPKGLIDNYTIIIAPVALGKGRTMFEGAPEPIELKAVSTRSFRNGNVVTQYSSAGSNTESPRKTERKQRTKA